MRGERPQDYGFVVLRDQPQGDFEYEKRSGMSCGMKVWGERYPGSDEWAVKAVTPRTVEGADREHVCTAFSYGEAKREALRFMRERFDGGGL